MKRKACLKHAEGSVIVDGLNVDLALVDGKVVEAIPQSRTEV